MKRIYLITLILILSTICSTQAQSFPQDLKQGAMKDPWSKSELLEPAILAALIKKTGSVKPLIYNIGVVDNIKGAKSMGAVTEKENLARFKKALQNLPKNSEIVVYCGCCPFDRCPNIRPAFQAMKNGGFINGKLLNLPVNVKTDWINKGYPLEN